MKAKRIVSRLTAAFPNLKKRTASVLGRTWGVTLPCAALLLLTSLLETACAAGGSGARGLMELLASIVVLPVTAAAITYAAGASWEGRKATIADAYHLARIRLKEIVITGLAAGVIVLLTDWLASMASALIGIIPALLGWIPVIGPVITAAVSLAVWLVSLAMEFVAHVVLAAGMLPLTADGVAGRAQAERALGILRSGGEDILYQLGLVFALWIAAGGVQALLTLMFAPAGALIGALLTAVSVAAVSVIYLQARDRRDGMRYHV